MMGDHIRPSAWLSLKLLPKAVRRNTDCGDLSGFTGRSAPPCTCRKLLAGSDCPNDAKVPNVVVPEPKPRARFPVGSATSPCTPKMLPECTFENSTRFQPSAISPTPPSHPVPEWLKLNGIATSS